MTTMFGSKPRTVNLELLHGLYEAAQDSEAAEQEFNLALRAASEDMMAEILQLRADVQAARDVWLVAHDRYDDHHVRSAWSSRTAAEAEITRLKAKNSEGCENLVVENYVVRT